MIGITNAGGGGSGNRATLTALADAGDTVTITLDATTTQTKTVPAGQTSVKFTILKFGTWTVENGDYHGTIDILASGEYEIDTHGHIFGIRREITSSSPTWERTDDSVGFTVTPSVGTVAGSSDFDNYPPYNGIVRETIGGNTFVKIPKFWFQRYQEDGYEYIKITNAPRQNFSLHPAFQHNGTTQDYIYVGAYKMNASYGSTSGAAPLVNKTLAAFRSGANALGNGYSLIDVSTRFAIMMLMLVELADNNVQDVIGQGVVGASSSFIYNTGACDSLTYYTGRTSASSELSETVWRGIEGLWSYYNEFIDGLKIYGKAYYICNNQEQYNSNTNKDNYTQLGYAFNVGKSDAFYAYCGYDNNYPAYFLPVTKSSDPTASMSTYVCDALTCNTSNIWYAGAFGGQNRTITTNNRRYWQGLFRAKLDFGIGSTDANTTSRLLYIPS